MTTSVPRLPLSTHYTPEQALQVALAEGLQDVMVIGCDSEGHLFAVSNRMTRAEGLWLIERARDWALHGKL
jgi:hypothetical protein